MSTSQDSYHHGDLRAALLVAAIDVLESGDAFSLRAVARRAGVSAAAPYRHFADREALESAIAVAGFDELRAALSASLERIRDATPEEIVTALSVTYVLFALHHPARFRLMFGQECNVDDEERVRAAGELHAFLGMEMSTVLPGAEDSGLATALWSTAHGLACLHLDGKLKPTPQSAVFDRVRTVVAALFAMGRPHDDSRQPAAAPRA